MEVKFWVLLIDDWMGEKSVKSICHSLYYEWWRKMEAFKDEGGRIEVIAPISIDFHGKFQKKWNIALNS